MNIKQEVESVLQRALIGHEKAVVITLNRQGMMNPIDIAREMLTRHLANNDRQLDGIMNQRAELQLEMARLDAAELPKER